MPKRYYAFQNYDTTKHVRAAIREKSISHKHAREIAVAMKGLSIEKARDYLLDVQISNEVFHSEDIKIRLGINPIQEQCRVDIHKKQQQKS